MKPLFCFSLNREKREFKVFGQAFYKRLGGVRGGSPYCLLLLLNQIYNPVVNRDRKECYPCGMPQIVAKAYYDICH